MYKRETWYFEKSIEREFKWKGEYGRKGEKRGKRRKATPEQVKEQNKRNKENRVRRVMKANFHENDLWITLKYPAGTKLAIEEVKKHMRKFLERVRNRYKRREETLKFIYRIEIGKRGSPHVHILMNRITDADLIVREAWEQGRIFFTPAYEQGGFRKLANYIVKPPDLEVDPEGTTVAYSTSRNLIRPEPEIKPYWRRTVEKIIREGPKPTPGYAIDPNTIVSGVNPYTGMSYLRYEEIKLERGGKSARGKRIRGDNS